MTDIEDAFEKIVGILNSEPYQECVVREEFLIEDGLDAEALAAASKRPVRRTTEVYYLPDKNMALRDAVFVFGPKQEA